MYSPSTIQTHMTFFPQYDMKHLQVHLFMQNISTVIRIRLQKKLPFEV